MKAPFGPMVPAALLLFSCLGLEPPPPPPVVLEVVPPPPQAVAAEVLDEPPTWGQRCSDDADCAPGDHPARCLCGLPLPEGGAATTGFCWSGKLRTGAWWCTVEDGHAFPHGVIIPP